MRELTVWRLAGQGQGDHSRLLCVGGHVMQHQLAFQQVVSLLVAGAGGPTHNRSLKREPDAVDLPGGERQLLPRQAAGGEKESERRALVTFAVTQPATEAAQSG